MSHRQSPGPSAQPSQSYQQNMQPSSGRGKNKNYAASISAGVEDEKYQAKYKELKRKVKEIELDNDKLHYKVIQAKRSIQRMKLERAILYERLSAVPPSPDASEHHALPAHSAAPGAPSHYAHPASGPVPSHPQQRPEHDERYGYEYPNTHGNSRARTDSHGYPTSDASATPGVTAPHLSPAQMSRHSSGAGGHDSSRQLPPLSHLTPAQHYEHPRSLGHSQGHSPHLHPHSNGSHSHSRSRSHSSSRSRPNQVPTGYHPGHSHAQHYSPEVLPLMQQSLHSPPREPERTRRHELLDRGSAYADPHMHNRGQTQPQSHSSHTPALSPTHGRSSTRIHNHQRVGPGANLPHPDLDRERDLEREREWSRQHEQDFDRDYRAQHPIDRGDYQDHPPSYRPRDDPAYHRDPIRPGVHRRLSRSGSPGSGGGGPPEHIRSEHHQYYDREMQRPPAPRGAGSHQSPSTEELGFVHEDGRSFGRDRGHLVPPEQHRSVGDISRKRSRADMEVDEEYDVADASAVGSGAGGRGDGSRYSGRHPSEDRGLRALHASTGRPPSRASNDQEEPPEAERSD